MSLFLQQSQVWIGDVLQCQLVSGLHPVMEPNALYHYFHLDSSTSLETLPNTLMSEEMTITRTVQLIQVCISTNPDNGRTCAIHLGSISFAYTGEHDGC